MTQELTINARAYPLPARLTDSDQPIRPVVVICLDGCEPNYLDHAMDAGLMPNLQKLLKTGNRFEARSAMPSFTNPNNMSIATGQPPKVHGISGNYFLDPDSGEEVLMNDPALLRAPTIFSQYFEAGARVAVVTAKDKLRAMLGSNLRFDEDRAICFSSEKADQASLADNGLDDASAWLNRPVPEVYSADLSEFVFAAGVKLLQEWKPDLLYLTTTDYVQHKSGPGAKMANDFYAMFDRYLGDLLDHSQTLLITADHGMKDKVKEDGSPDVIYLQSLLDDWLGKDAACVILPITDPYVVHHGALGAFATAYLPDGCHISDICQTIKNLDGVVHVLTREEAVTEFELPADRIGDIVVTVDADKVLGTSPDRHDLSALKEPLRSHGGPEEQIVPLILNTPLPEAFQGKNLRNFDAFAIALTASAE